MANAALINFFGNASTISSIMQTVQQTQQQSNLREDTTININETHLTSTEQWQQLKHNPQVMVSGIEEEGMSNNLLNATQIPTQ